MPSRGARFPLMCVLLVCLVGAMAGTASSKVKPNSENNKKLGPRASAGEFLGFPTPTYQWHGCTRTATANDGRGPLPGAPPHPRGTRQSAVTFLTNRAAPPYFKWTVKSGYRICGVQAQVELSNPTVRSRLLAEVGYTSGIASGSTVPTGRETISVKIARNAINHAQFRQYEGKTYSIATIHHVVVFVKAK